MSIPGCLVKLNEEAVERMMSVLPVGRDNAVTMAKLQSRMGFRRQRTAETARALVKYAIEDHQRLICTGNVGVWEPITVGEVHDYIRSLQVRIMGIEKRVTALNEALIIRAGNLADQEQ